MEEVRQRVCECIWSEGSCLYLLASPSAIPPGCEGDTQWEMRSFVGDVNTGTMISALNTYIHVKREYIYTCRA